MTRLDYGNTLLTGISTDLNGRLQSVLNSAARMIHGLGRRDHIIQTLADIHWLGEAERIDFKLAILANRCLHDIAPIYLSRNLCLASDLVSKSRL